MKKAVIFLLLIVGFVSSCSSDGDDKTTVNSSIVIDGIGFSPKKSTYSYVTASFTSQKEVHFILSNEAKKEVFYINILFPSSQKDLTGVYSFGPGTADELLASSDFIRGDNDRYGILGYTLNITDLGNSKFKFVFIQASAFNIVKNKTASFTGGLEGTFEFTKVK
jgi:hypothetical protein